MDGSKPLFVLEVEGGQASARQLRFRTDRRQDPISIGTGGQWVLVGPGVRELHGYVAFDGSQLFLQTANPHYPLRVGGAAVSTEWQAVSPPARIAVGGVTLTYTQNASDSPGESQPPPPPGDDDDERTRFRPAEPPQVQDDVTRADPQARDDETQADPPRLYERNDPQDLTRVMPPAPETAPLLPRDVATGPMPGELSSPQSAQPAMDRELQSVDRVHPPFFLDPTPPPILNLPPRVSPPAPKPTAPHWRQAIDPFLQKAAAQWKETSTPKKAVVFLLPLAFVAVFVMFDETPKAARPAASARRPSSVAPTTSVTVATKTSTTPVAPVGPKPPPDPPRTSAPSPGASSPAPAGKTPERLAVDAVAAGEYADAVRRYDELARQHGDQPVYREASRILRSKLDAGVP